MNKETFLSQLESMLFDIPKEERDEAMDFYRSYFEEAGPENEAAVIEELESPKNIAAGIKEELEHEGNMTSFLKNPPEVRTGRQQSEQSAGEKGPQSDQTGGSQDTSRGRAGGMFSGNDFQKSEDRADSASGKASYRRYDQYDNSHNQKGVMDRHSKWILFIIIAVFTAPVWGALLSGVIGIFGAAVAAVAVLAVFAVGGLVGGAACAVTGIINICTLSLVRGLLLLGAGMLLVAGSGLSIVILLLLCFRLLPWAVHQVRHLLRRLWNWGRSAA